MSAADAHAGQDPARMLIIGCGNMGGAMLAGWLANGLEADRFAILDPGLETAPNDVALYREPEHALEAGHDAVLLGFKPQQLSALAKGLQPLANDANVVHSLLAGVTVEQLERAFPKARSHIRVMPNLAARIGKSPVLLHSANSERVDRDGVVAFYNGLGFATWLDEEAQFDLATALAGSGPGFVYRFIDALAQAATELGLGRDQADALALAMVEGAAALAADADILPGELATRVASPGGMTCEGLDVLDTDDALVRLLTRTLRATRDRGAVLSSRASS